MALIKILIQGANRWKNLPLFFYFQRALLRAQRALFFLVQRWIAFGCSLLLLHSTGFFVLSKDGTKHYEKASSMPLCTVGTSALLCT
jgi:hypothetical protein